MSAEAKPGDAESRFIDDQFNAYTRTAMDALSVQFLREEADRFKQDVEVICFEGTDKGDAVPVVSCDFMDRKLLLVVEEGSVLDYAERFVSDSEAEGLAVADVTRLLVGAGVARAILAWRLLPIVGDDIEEWQKQAIQDRICNKKGLWEMADACDASSDTSFRLTVEKMNDDQVAIVNALRFGFGASLNYLSDAHDLEITIPKSFILRLNEQEEARRLDLRTNMAILDQDSAYKLFDDSAPLLSIALSFPMSLSELKAL